MPLAEDLQSRLDRTVEPRRCKLFHLGLTDEEMSLVLLYIDKIREDQDLPQADRFFTMTSLQDIMAKNKVQMSRTAISSHVRGSCCCDD